MTQVRFTESLAASVRCAGTESGLACLPESAQTGAESFFQLLKRERVRRKTYLTRDEAREDVFDYTEVFYNRKRKHVSSNMLPPAECERQYFMRLGAV